MAFVFACSRCGKRFQVHKGGVTVACPHCGSHEKIPESEAAPEATPLAPPVPPLQPGGDEIGEAKTDLNPSWQLPAEESEPTHPWMPPADGDEPPPPWSPGDDDDVPAWSPGGDEVPALDWAPVEPNPGGSSTLTAGATQTTTPIEAPAESSPAVAPATTPAPGVSRATPGVRKAEPARRQGLSHFQMLMYYATLMTALCGYLAYSLYLKPPHQLESLPDIRPLKEKETQIVPENAGMPRFHTLALGEEQRYGNLRVKPVRVTRETVQFVTGPETVLRLWLDLTNVSTDQPFVPIGEALHDAQVPVDQKKYPDAQSIFRANNFVARISEKAPAGKRVLLMPSWMLENHQLDQPLPPGETRKTALSTESEGIDELTGKLVWRLHLRKGHNPDSGRGVTTVIEVSFDSSQIEGGKG